MSLSIYSINVGASANDGTGDDIRDAFIKVNTNTGTIATEVDNIDGRLVNTFGSDVNNPIVANFTITDYHVGNLYFSGVDTIYVGGSPVQTAATGFNGGTVGLATTFTSGTASTSKITGAVILSGSGGLGVGGNTFIGGNLSAASTTAATSATTGAIVTAGGLGVAKNAWIGGSLQVVTGATLSSTIGVAGVASFTNSTEATNVATAAVVVSGGLGVAKNIVVGGNGTVAGNLTVTGTMTAGNVNFTTTTFSIADNLMELHKPSDGSLLTTDDGKDIGILMRTYKSGTGANIAGLVWANDTTFLEYYGTGIETGSSTFSGVYGTGKFGELWTVNTTASTSTTTGAFRTAGGLGAAGNIYAGGNIVGSSYGIFSTLTAATIGNTGAVLTGTLSTAAQTNITSLGTLTGLTVTGNATTGNIITAGVYAATIGNTGAAIRGSSVVVSGNINSGNLITTGVYAVSIGNTGTQGTFGNITTTNGIFWANGLPYSPALTSSGAANVTISGTNIVLTATGPGAVSTGSSTAIPIITTDAYGRVASVSTAAVVAPASTLSGTTLASGVITSSLTTVGTLGNLAVTGNANIVGNVITTGIYAATVGNNSSTVLNGTLSTASQPNITAVGTLSVLTVTGNARTGNVIASGIYANIIGNTSSLINGTLQTGDQPNITGVGNLGGLTVTGTTYLSSPAYLDGVAIATIGGSASFTSINSTPIGNVTPSTGAFTTVYAANLTANNSVITKTLNAATIGNTGAAVTGATGVFDTSVVAGSVAAPTIGNAGAVFSGSTGTFSGNVNSGNVITSRVYAVTIGNTGAVLTGTLSTAAQTNITSLGTLSGLAVGGTITATTLNAATIGNTGAVLTGTLSTAAQTNITSLGTLTGLVASGNITAANIIAGGVYAATIGNTGAVLTGTLSTAAQTNITSLGTLSGLSVGGIIAASTVTAATIGNSGASIFGTISTAAQTNITSLGTLTGLVVSGTTSATTAYSTDLTANNSITTKTLNAATIGNTGAQGVFGNITTTNGLYWANGAAYSNGPYLGGVVNANVFPSANLTINSGGPSNYWGTTWTGQLTANTAVINAGTANAMVATGNVWVAGNIIPFTSNSLYNLGSATSWWGTLYGVSSQAKYADLAELYLADAEYDPGTVLVFGGEFEVTTTTEQGDVSVAGVVSTNPAYLMNAQSGGVPIALRGRVPVKVLGTVKKGDLLVTSNKPGIALSVGKNYLTYGVAIFAKSLTDKTTDDVGIIEAVII